MHRVEHLTDTQEGVLRCIRQAIADRGEAPTVREIGEALGMRSRSSVLLRASALHSNGWLRWVRLRPQVGALDHDACM